MLIFSPTANANITYVEVPGSPHEAYVNNQVQVTRILECPWEERWDLAAALLGFSELGHDNNGNAYVFRYTPDAYPVENIRGADWIYATQIQSIEGKQAQPFAAGDPNFGQPNYALARLTVLYESLTYTVLEDDDPTVLGTAADNVSFVPLEENLTRYITRHYQPNAEALILPRGSFKWCPQNTGDPRPDAGFGTGARANTFVSNTNTRIQSTVEATYTWHQVPGIPKNARDMIGRINNAVFDTSLVLDNGNEDPGFAAGTLMLTGVEYRPFKSIGGVKVYDVIYKFRHFTATVPGSSPAQLYAPERGHNYFLRYFDNDLCYELITRDGTVTGMPIFTPDDFSKLFKGPFVRDPGEVHDRP